MEATAAFPELGTSRSDPRRHSLLSACTVRDHLFDPGYLGRAKASRKANQQNPLKQKVVVRVGELVQDEEKKVETSGYPKGIGQAIPSA